MRRLFFYYDQQSVSKRSLSLFAILVLLTLGWYIIFAQKLWGTVSKEKIIKENNQITLSQLYQLSARKSDFAFKHDLARLQLRQVLSSLTSGESDLSVTSFADGASQTIPAGAVLFPRASQALGIHLLPFITQKAVTVQFSGGFYSFRDYLKAIQKSPYSVYFEKIDFNMTAYPKAKIILEVFTLEGA